MLQPACGLLHPRSPPPPPPSALLAKHRTQSSTVLANAGLLTLPKSRGVGVVTPLANCDDNAAAAQARAAAVYPSAWPKPKQG